MVPACYTRTMDLSVIADFSLRIGSLFPQGFISYLRALPPAVPEQLRQIAFRRTLRLAEARSAFYREKFARHGIRIENIKRPEDFGSFYTEPEELREAPE